MTLPPLRHAPDPTRDLVLERVIDVPREAVWAAYTTPALLMQWFTPAPWRTTDCEIDLRPGGIFRTVMRSPEGKEFPNDGCVLEVAAPAKFVWTGALAAGYRPRTTEEAAGFPFMFTAVITLEALGASSTKYTALVIHSDVEGAAKHATMGFHQGWGAALDQLVALVRSSAA